MDTTLVFRQLMQTYGLVGGWGGLADLLYLIINITHSLT